MLASLVTGVKQVTKHFIALTADGAEVAYHSGLNYNKKVLRHCPLYAQIISCFCSFSIILTNGLTLS